MWEAILLTSQIFILGVIGWGAYEYFRLKERVVYYYSVAKQLVKLGFHKDNMDCDKLIDQLLEQEEEQLQQAPAATSGGPQVTHEVSTWVAPTTKKRERLAAMAAGGQAKQYLGRSVTADQVGDMADEEIEKLYARYETRLGVVMTKTLGKAALQLYAGIASAILPIPAENQPRLVADLEEDPFVAHALSTAVCELYHLYGMFLAPLTTALTTAKHCQFGGPAQPPINKDVGPDSTNYSCPEGTGTDTECCTRGDPLHGSAATGKSNSRQQQAKLATTKRP